MSAAAILAEARRHGVTLSADGERLQLTATSAPPPELLALIRENKPAILAALADEARAKAERWRALFAERFAEAQAAGRDPAESRRQAFDCITAQWRCENPPAPTEPGDDCAGCGQKPVADKVPFLAGGGGHVWMHRECWQAYDARRQAEAENTVRALLGVTP